ncbi:MAG: winged helix DNA-binding domain-containing protein [Actinomycetota bacterium]|nr:winged helix DNA-binding domain-containing protein [Actinomycetota bacterium]
MPAAPTISPETARRFLALRHSLAPPRALPPGREGILAVFERFGSIQFDPLEVAGRNHDLVLLARVPGYRRELTDALLYEERVLYETYNKGLSLVPTADLPWFRLTWDLNRAAKDGGVFVEHAPLVEELLERIRADGQLSSTDIAPRAAIDWYWRPTNQVRAILEALAQAGILAIARREGNRRIYDLVERLFPADLLAQRPPELEQRRFKLLSRYRAHGLLGTGGQAEVWLGTGPGGAVRRERLAELVEGGEIVPMTVDGLRGERHVVTAELPLLERAEREVAAGDPPGGTAPGAAFVAPLDPLVWDRNFLRSLYGFDYLWEVYVPAAKRRWGYYVLPLYFADRFVGRIEPRIDRKAGVLQIVRLWWEDGFDPLATEGFSDAFTAALDAHRRFASVDRIRLPRTARARGIAAEVRKRMG